MLRKIFSAMAILTALIFLTACGSNDKPQTPATSEKVAAASAPVAAPTPEAPKADSVEGSWATDGMVAVVKGGVITINFKSEDTTALYWVGTFPTSMEDGSNVVSKGDTETMYKSLMASQDAKKKFTYEDGELSFDVSMMGTTKTAHLNKK